MSKEKFERTEPLMFGGHFVQIHPRQGPSDTSGSQQPPPATSGNAPSPSSTPPANSGGGSSSTPPPPPPSSSSSSSISSSSSSTSSGPSSSSTPPPPPPSSSSNSNAGSSSGSSPASSGSNSSTSPPPTSAAGAISQSSSTTVLVTLTETNSQGSIETITSTSSGLVPVLTSTGHTSSAASSSPPTATIVGATVGGVAGLILLALVIAFCVRRRRNSWKDDFDGNFDPDRTTSAPGLYGASQYRDDPDLAPPPPPPPPSRPSRDELRQTSFNQPATTGDVPGVHVEPFVLPGRGGVSPPPGMYPQQQTYFDPRGQFVQQQQQQPHLQPQGYYGQQQQYRPAHNTSLSASTITHYTGSDTGSGAYLLDSAGAGVAARPSKDREAFGGSRTASTGTSGASAQSYPPSTPAAGAASVQSSSSASGKQAAYAIANPYVIANPPPSPPLPNGSPGSPNPLGYGGIAGPLRVANPSRQNSGHSEVVNNDTTPRTNSPTRNASPGVLVHRDAGRVPNSESIRLDEIPPTYDSIGK